MSLRDMFKRPPKAAGDGPATAELDQGMYYVYMIIGLQIVFVLGLAGAVMLMGTVISTPLWVYLTILVAMIGGCYYIYRRVKARFRKFGEALQKAARSDRNYEISFMGGFLTMRVEQSANAQRLLEAPAAETVIEAETVEAPVGGKSAENRVTL